ncbi:MAG: hypothetical protein WAK61_00380 [Leclercia sp.]
MKTKLVTVFFCLSVAGAAHAITPAYRAQLARSGCTQATDGNGCDIHKSKSENNAFKRASHGHQKTNPAEYEAAAKTMDQALAGKSLSEVVPAIVAAGWKQDENAPLEFTNDGVRMVLDVNQSNDKVMGVILK